MNAIVSVNVGLPRDVSSRGQTVRTARWKLPVRGKVFASHFNLDGNAQADPLEHGCEQRAVTVYQFASYRYWDTSLDRPGFDPALKYSVAPLNPHSENIALVCRATPTTALALDL